MFCYSILIIILDIKLNLIKMKPFFRKAKKRDTCINELFHFIYLVQLFSKTEEIVLFTQYSIK